jgi:hypothetical protein
MVKNYARLEADGTLKPEPVDEKARAEQKDSRLNALSADRTEATGKIVGSDARDMDGMLKDAKKRAKAKTPMIRSMPGQSAKISKLHQ